MTSFNIFDFNSFVNNNNNIFNVLRNQRNLQAHCDFRALFVRSTSNISISRFLLQFIFFNKHVIIDFVSFSLSSIKQIRLTSLFSLSSIKRIRLTSFVRNKRDRKSSTFYVSATSSVDIRFIQFIIIRCESLKKRKDWFSKNEADIIKQKSTVTEKKKRNKFVKSNVAQNICESLKKKRDRFSKIEADLIEHKSNVAEKKVIKCIVMHDRASELCAKMTRRRIYCLRRFLFRRLLWRLLHVENAILVTNTKVFLNFFSLISMKSFDQRVYTASLMTSII